MVRNLVDEFDLPTLDSLTINRGIFIVSKCIFFTNVLNLTNLFLLIESLVIVVLF